MRLTEIILAPNVGASTKEVKKVLICEKIQVLFGNETQRTSLPSVCGFTQFSPNLMLAQLSFRSFPAFSPARPGFISASSICFGISPC